MDSSKKNGINGLHRVEMPRERLEKAGREALKDEELLAILLGTGYKGKNVLKVAASILRKHPKEKLVHLDIEALKKLKGLGTAKAAILVAAFELTKRALNEGNGALPSVSSPSDVLPLIADIRTKRKEHFVAIYLNARNQIIHREEISVGSLSASIVHPREVFQPAVEVSAASLILAHNHPSGDVLPSKDDVEITKRMAEAGKIMGIEVLDHIIIGAERFLSLKEKSVIR